MKKHVQRSYNMSSCAGFSDFLARGLLQLPLLQSRGTAEPWRGPLRPCHCTTAPRSRPTSHRILGSLPKMERERLTPVLNARAASTEGSRRVVNALASGSMIMMGAKSAYTNTSNCTKAELSLAVCKKHAACWSECVLQLSVFQGFVALVRPARLRRALEDLIRHWRYRPEIDAYYFSSRISTRLMAATQRCLTWGPMRFWVLPR